MVFEGRKADKKLGAALCSPPPLLDSRKHLSVATGSYEVVRRETGRGGASTTTPGTSRLLYKTYLVANLGEKLAYLYCKFDSSLIILLFVGGNTDEVLCHVNKCCGVIPVFHCTENGNDLRYFYECDQAKHR